MEATKADEQAGSGSIDSKPIVCFLGPVSSYTHQATMEAFPPDQYDLMPVTTIKDVFDTTQSGAVMYGVVPFENSTNGSVVFTLDHFADRSDAYRDLNVCREIYLDVHHCLLGHIPPPPPPPPPPPSSSSPDASAPKPDPTLLELGKEASGSGQQTPTPQHPHPRAARSRPLHAVAHVRRVYSHPQAFGQCTAFLGAWLHGVETVDVSSTSRAAELALADPTGESAAISSAAAAELLGLDVLARNIEDRDDNTTRFFVLRRGVGDDDVASPVPAGSTPAQVQTQAQAQTQTQTPSSAIEPAARPREEEDDDDSHLLSSTKSLLSFTVPHRSPGALADVLSCFRRGGLNLTSINSRPSLLRGAAAFEYIFFVEFEGHRFRDPRGRVARVLRDVAAVARTARWLGSWENMRRRSLA